MPFVELDLASLQDLDDGRVAVAFQHELKRAVQDCIDRPADKKPRTVTLELAIKPNIKFRKSDSGASSIQHGSESLGRTIEAEVSGAGDIPESVVVSCPVYANHGEREKTATIMYDLEIVPADGQFRFRPIPDELERVIDAALDDIRTRIVDALPDGSAVFFGSP